MAKKQTILVDTDILIKVFRGDATIRKILNDNKGNLAVTIISYFELLSGLKTRQRIIDLNKQMKAYEIIHITESVSIHAFNLYQKYSTKYTLHPADTIIASTAIINNYTLLTNNVADFSFFKDLKHYTK